MREEKLILCTKYYFIRAFILVIINAKLFLLLWTINVFFISVILWAVCNKIKTNMVNCRISCGKNSKKKKEKTTTQKHRGFN